jgi:hypothetical protein
VWTNMGVAGAARDHQRSPMLVLHALTLDGRTEQHVSTYLEEDHTMHVF